MADDISQKEEEAVAIMDQPLNNGGEASEGFGEVAWRKHGIVHNNESGTYDSNSTQDALQRRIAEIQKRNAANAPAVEPPKPASSIRDLVFDSVIGNKPKPSASSGELVDMQSIIEGDDEQYTQEDANAALEEFERKRKAASGFSRNPHAAVQTTSSSEKPIGTPGIADANRTAKQIEMDKRATRLGRRYGGGRRVAD